MQNETYDCSFFINFFSAIPEEKWCRQYFTSPDDDGAHCALGHCGRRASSPLSKLFQCFALSVTVINDGLDHRYRQPTPKQRILAALRDIKAKQEPKAPIAKPPCSHLFLALSDSCLYCGHVKTVQERQVA